MANILDTTAKIASVVGLAITIHSLAKRARSRSTGAPVPATLDGWAQMRERGSGSAQEPHRVRSLSRGFSRARLGMRGLRRDLMRNRGL